MELKTLRDIDPEACCHGIRKPDLKKEAIKWINADEDKWLENGFDKDNVDNFIAYFFNLTEDDLK